MMNATKVVESFKECMKGSWQQDVSDGKTEKGFDDWLSSDEPMADEAFNNYTDSLRKDGEIPAWLYDCLTLESDLEDLDQEVEEFQKAIEFFNETTLTREQIEEAMEESSIT